tara:strand:+ start:1466 stop:1996 length:531 start_codon:yes stop_codon:yes gene_type:complete
MALKSIYKKRGNPMMGMGSMPAGYPSMSQKQQTPYKPLQFPRQRWRPLAPQPRQHTTYNLAAPNRKLKQRGRAIIDANPYRTSLRALQRGTNVPIRLIGGEVRGHGGSRYSRQRKAYYDRLNREAAAKGNADKEPRDVKTKKERDDEKWLEFFGGQSPRGEGLTSAEILEKLKNRK